MKTVLQQQDMESHASAFRQGLHTGMTNLFDAWYPSLCRYVHSMINDWYAAEELASEAFVKTWAHRRQLHCAGDIRAYLFTIARRDAFRSMQQKQKNRQVAICDQQPLMIEDTLEILRSEMRNTISDAIRTLPPRCRQIFELLYMEGKNTEEVAKELVISPYTVRAQKARGLSLLRPKLLTVFN